MSKILVVDDDDRQKDLYLDLFKGKGYEVVSAYDGLEGLEVALKESPDLVFTGIIMPRMDGFEFIRNLRSNVKTSNLPVIMFSHLGREEDRQKAKALPGVEFMVKGLDGPKDILAKIEKLIGHKHKP
jgi:CheY-like chemotaxis protein